jgi:hypothetical protein
MTALYGDAKMYRYALNDGVPKPWTKELIEKVANYNYDVCLLNYYRNGKDKFKFHSDREEIGNDVPIASVSFGTERKIYFRSIPKFGREDEEHCIILGHGSLLIMGKGCHENYIHGLPTDNKVKSERLNLTFRKTTPNNNPTLVSNFTPIMPPILKPHVVRTTVVNKKVDKDYDVYIGRPSKWGNPFKMKTEGDRNLVIGEYRKWILTQSRLLRDLHELKGKRIACFCKPLACHGDVLAELADNL